MPEKRRGKKDVDLQRTYEEVRTAGTRCVSSNQICRRIGANALKFRGKRENITGLQICDLIAHPSHMWVRSFQNHAVQLGPYAQRIIPILKASKFDRSPSGIISGYGVKYLP